MARLRRSMSSLSGDGDVRPVCPHGVKCYRRNPDHLAQEAHPADQDYLDCCRKRSIVPEFVSIRKLFEWTDADGHGRATRANLQSVWHQIQSYGENVGDLTDDLWNTLDDDGNGHINFSELAEFTTLKNLSLPLGLDDLFGESNAGASLKCGVIDCNCENFVMRRARCRYGIDCYQKNEEHRARFCHPGDEEWEKREGPGGREMCRCGHKKSIHASSASGAAAVPYPDYWTCNAESGKGVSSSSDAVGGGAGDFLELVPVDDATMAMLQALVDSTYSDVTTRDRQRHSGSWMVPRDYTVQEAWRVENSKLWRKYCVRKAILAEERSVLCKTPGVSPYEVRSDVKTMHWAQDRLNSEINEWYLWHGTSGSAAQNICRTDFKMCLAGSATGTLYGRGAYLAESITKADEYSKGEGGFNTVLLCRVLGGNVRYCDERTPDPDALTADCVEGDYDLILGDRVKTSGTYREFIVFDTENVYPEYIVKYKRGEVFKSPSHP